MILMKSFLLCRN